MGTGGRPVLDVHWQVPLPGRQLEIAVQAHPERQVQDHLEHAGRVEDAAGRHAECGRGCQVQQQAGAGVALAEVSALN